MTIKVKTKHKILNLAWLKRKENPFLLRVIEFFKHQSVKLSGQII